MLDQDAPKTRQELVNRLAELREQGILDPVEETNILQHYERVMEEVEEEKSRLEPEFERRRDEDGIDAASAWLAEAARDLGRRHGEATRQVTDKLRVVTG